MNDNERLVMRELIGKLRERSGKCDHCDELIAAATALLDAPVRKVQRYEMVQLTSCGEAWQELQRDDDGEWCRYEDIAPAPCGHERLLEAAAYIRRWCEKDPCPLCGGTSTAKHGTLCPIVNYDAAKGE